MLSQVYDCDIIAKFLTCWRDAGSEWRKVSLPREQNLVTINITAICAPRLSLFDRPLLLPLDGKSLVIMRDGMLSSSRITLINHGIVNAGRICWNSSPLQGTSRGASFL